MVLTDNAVNCFCEEVGIIIGGDHDRNRSIAAHIRLPLPCADGSTSLETTIAKPISSRSKSQSRQSGKSRLSPLPAFGSQKYDGVALWTILLLHCPERCVADRNRRHRRNSCPHSSRG